MATKTENQTQTQTLLNVLNSARAELKALVERGINLAEKRSKAVFRFARTVTKRIGGGAKSKRKS